MYVFMNLIFIKAIIHFVKITSTIDYTLFCPILMVTSYKKYISIKILLKNVIITIAKIF